MTTKQSDILALEPTVRAWADIVIEKWIRKIHLLGIAGSDLVASFAREVMWASGGDLQKVKFAFDYVGKFTDMGVGNGVSLETRDALISAGLTKRRQRPWIRPVLNKELAFLCYKISERLVENTQLAIVRSLSEDSPPLTL